MKKIITLFAIVSCLFFSSNSQAQSALYIDFPLPITPSGVEINFGVTSGAPADFYFEIYRGDPGDSILVATIPSLGFGIENYLHIDPGPFINATEYLYVIHLFDANGNIISSAWSTATFYENPYFFEGKIAYDENGNCLVGVSETPLSNWTIIATDAGGTSYFGSTDTDGNYQITTHDVGDYTINAYPPNAYWGTCNNNITINATTAWETTVLDFAANSAIDCPAMSVDIGMPFLRRCLPSTYYVSYCNQGTELAANAQLEIILDPQITFDASANPPSTINGDTLLFDLGDVGIGECSSFSFTVILDCDAVVGATYCVEANITPNNFCTPANALWDGSSILVGSKCENGEIIFTLKNKGSDMLQSRAYQVVEDNVMLMHGNFQLNENELLAINMDDNGKTLRLIAEQSEFHPGNSHPTTHIEGCDVTPFSLGFVNMFPEDDENRFTSKFCIESVDSFDPNDKQAFPKGYDAEHYIAANRDIDYMIRFQNTGTAEAINVTIVDTIDQNFDLTKIQFGSSSHPYHYTLYDEGIIAFEFVNIMLPDSNTNEPESHGFVKYTISQRPDLPVGTVLQNKAAIYFDFNEPVITNETFHTIGQEFITVSIDEPIGNQLVTKVYPNPFSEKTTFEIDGEENQNYSFKLFSLEGKLVREEIFYSKTFDFARKNLPAGIFIFKIENEGVLLGAGKIIVQK